MRNTVYDSVPLPRRRVGARYSVRYVVGAVPVALAGVAALSIGTALWATRAQRHDAVLLNLLGRQRMLVQGVVREAFSSLRYPEQAPARLAAMHARVHELERGLRALEGGGQVPYLEGEVRVPGVSDARVRAALREALVAWGSLHGAAHAVMGAEAGSAVSARALGDLEAHAGTVLAGVERVVRLYQRVAERRVAVLRWAQLGLLALAALVLLWGYWLFAGQVIRPLEALEAGIRDFESRGGVTLAPARRGGHELERLSRAFDEMRARVRARLDEQQALLALSEALGTALEPRAVAETVAAALREELAADFACLMALDEDGRSLTLVGGVGWPEELYGAHRVELERSLEGKALREGRLVQESVGEDHSELWPVAELCGRRIRSGAAVPLTMEGVPVGALSVHFTRPYQLSADETVFLKLVAGQTAVALARAKAYGAAKTAEARYRGLFEGVPTALLRSTPDGTLLDANPAAAALLGYPSVDALREIAAVEHYVEPGDRERWLALVGRDGVVRQFETRLRRRDGGVITVLLSARAVRDPEGGVRWYEISVEDITARKTAEERLRESEERFRTLVESAPYGILMVDPNHRILLVNDEAEQLFGYRRDELLGQSVNVLVPEGLAARHHEAIRRVGIYRGPMIRDPHRDAQGRRKDGTEFPIDVRIGPCRIGQEICFVAACADLSQRKALEAQLRQVQKLEAVGQLAGGIAHDFNNVLTVILSHTDLLLGDPGVAAGLRAELEEIHYAAARGAALTRQLLLFSRREPARPQLLSLNDVIRKMEEMLRRLIPESIQLVTDLDPELARIRCDPVALEQVILNLAVNARDAMPHGGTLAFRTRNAHLAADHPDAAHVAPAGDYVLLTVSDTGHGMDDHVLAHLFEPFFSTKGPGKGTGLGLATVHRIVGQSGGHIRVESRPGHGTTFRIYLPGYPREEQEAAPGESARPNAGRSRGGWETILLAEDEAPIRRAVRRILHRAGYTVLEAHDGEHALRVAAEYEGPIHLLITDMVMPHLGGSELAGRLRAARPEVKLLYMSGYSDGATLYQRAPGPGPVFVAKPFAIGALLNAVRDALDTPSTNQASA